MKTRWYSAPDYNIGKNQESVFGDSKFALDRKASFIREVIQNSLDVKTKNPVEISISIDKIPKNKIPGIDELVKRIESCLQIANCDAKLEYESALELLKREYVYCLKISDRNTRGVNADIDEKNESAWKALVYDLGNSYGKSRQGAAGSHGVGKKATFIISEANTVYYATKYKNNKGEDICLFEGKHMLSTWYDDNSEKMCGDGWYGIVDTNLQTEERVRAIKSTDNEYKLIDKYFLRTDDYGTDVIALALDYEGKEEKFKIHYINEVLENFYVAILDGCMEVNVLGEVINNQTIDMVFDNFYERQKGAILAGTNKCLLVGNLYDYKRVYQSMDPIVIPIEIDNKKVGEVNIYFDDNNEKRKKYYSIVRSHGMKIKDEKVNSEHEFSAVVKIMGDELNNLLLELENAAHDDFAVKDDTGIKYPERAIKALNAVKKEIQNYIIEHTKVEAEDVQKIRGLDSLLNLPGRVSTARIVKNEVDVVKPKPPKPLKPPVLQKYKLFEQYKESPMVFVSNNGYDILFSTLENVKKGIVKVLPVDFENKPNKSAIKVLEPMTIKLDGSTLNSSDGGYTFTKIGRNREHKIEIITAAKVPYNIALFIYEEVRDE